MDTRSIDFNKRVGANVRRLREAEGLSQADLSQEMKIRGHRSWVQQTVPRVERGSQPLKLQEACDVAEILGTDVTVLTEPSVDNETVAASATEYLQIGSTFARYKKERDEMDQLIAQLAHKLRDQERRLAEAGAFKGEDGNWYWLNADGSRSTLGGYEELLSR